MNPLVLICTYNRVEMTCVNIESLLIQSVVPKIILVTSSLQERDIFKSEFKDKVEIILVENRPLGRKFQYGVMAAKKFLPNPLIITGSDDILGKGFIENVCSAVSSGYDFVGFKQWFIYFQDVLYLYDYKPSIPLGTRAYSLKMLAAINWKVFDPSKERLLDDYGFYLAKASGLKMKIVTDAQKEKLHVISVKGDWPMLNPFERMRNHPNLKLVKVYDPADTEAIL